MKKITAVIFVFLLLGSALFAEDARVMPRMAGRISLNPSYSFETGFYDNNGNTQSYNYGSPRFFHLGSVLEFGITDWITTGFHWIPGWNFWHDKDTLPLGTKENDISDLTARIKFQIAGDRAPLRSSSIRFALAPTAIIPLSDLSNFSDKLMAGLSLHFDYIFNSIFYLYFYGQGLVYPSNFGEYYLNGEISPVFSLPVSAGLDIYAGLPISFFYSYLDSQTASALNIANPYSLGIKPFMSVFFKSFSLPLEFKLQYEMPLMGKNSLKAHNVSFQLMAYIVPQGRL